MRSPGGRVFRARIGIGGVEVGRALRVARRRAGRSLHWLADAMGVSAPYLCDVEHGRRSIPRISRAAKLLGTTVKALLGEERKIRRAELAWLNARPDLIRLLRDIRGRDRKPPGPPRAP